MAKIATTLVLRKTERANRQRQTSVMSLSNRNATHELGHTNHPNCSKYPQQVGDLEVCIDVHTYINEFTYIKGMQGWFARIEAGCMSHKEEVIKRKDREETHTGSQVAPCGSRIEKKKGKGEEDGKTDKGRQCLIALQFRAAEMTTSQKQIQLGIKLQLGSGCSISALSSFVACTELREKQSLGRR
jgi:hypothetical protein